MKLVKLETLEPGVRFRFPDSGKSGTVKAQGQMGTRILFDNASRVVEIGDVSFEAPGRPVIVSGGSEVVLL